MNLRERLHQLAHQSNVSDKELLEFCTSGCQELTNKAPAVSFSDTGVDVGGNYVSVPTTLLMSAALYQNIGFSMSQDSDECYATFGTKDEVVRVRLPREFAAPGCNISFTSKKYRYPKSVFGSYPVGGIFPGSLGITSGYFVVTGTTISSGIQLFMS